MVNAYYKFELFPKSGDSFSIIPIEKVHNHVTFNEIFESDNIEVKRVESASLSGNTTQYIISAKYHHSVMPICILQQTGDIGQMSIVNYFNNELTNDICWLGSGKFRKGLDDLILFKVTKDLIFEVYICENQYPSHDSLFMEFINGELQNELCNFNLFWYRSYYSNYRSAIKGCYDYDGYNININLLTDY
ncbi:hypothetical protein H9N25_10340 [Pedobacter riviphilus]|uniref:Uncharacterized protein n=1 Tax=Pedobacter riviphilus TaxID=2766984 RepID=A0ABX6TP65_9SPHI|nr:hypothetical protein [Pedobacter riviphilus]QNR86743.1 hypothetical protein H9N25_10340 [Pedobacter riviphilus]